MTSHSASAGTLRVEGVTKHFAGSRALDHVSLDVRPGEIHALVGQNGSGKSTLIKILSGYHKPDEGECVIDGLSFALGDPAASRHAGMRFVHQDLGLVATLNTTENLALGGRFPTGAVGRIRWPEAVADARRRLAVLGYDFDPCTPVGELEPAQRAGVAIARALGDGDAIKVLVVDEPTATLHHREVDVLLDALRRVSDANTGVIYVSHRLDEIFTIADRVTVLRDGRSVGTFDVADLDRRQLVALMLGSEQFADAALGAREPQPEVELSVRGLTGSVLRDFSLEVRRGEIVGISGVTGSGREEICGLLFGSKKYGHGEVSLGGRRLRSGSPRTAMRAGVAFVPGDRHGLGSVTVLNTTENLTLTDVKRHVAPWGRLRHGSERREMGDWIDRLSIQAPQVDAEFLSLSGGNQQKVVFAKWLRTKPSLLLLDEPTQGVDVHAKSAIHRLVDAAARDGAAVVVASADTAELCAMCDRVLVLYAGRVVAEFARPDIAEADVVHAALGDLPQLVAERQ